MDNLIIVKSSETSELRKWYDEIDDLFKNNLAFRFDEDLFFDVIVNSNRIGIISVDDYGSGYGDLKRFVHPDYQHKGIGTYMIDFLLKTARINKKIRVSGSLLSTNFNGIDFFKKNGFIITKGKTFTLVTCKV